jgi:hypothetical protein
VTVPALSYILATDTVETVRPVLEALRRQTRAAAVEVVLVAPSPLALDEVPSGLGAVREARCPAPLELPAAREIGVRAATAPIVFLGETHSYPEPGLVERLLGAFTAGGWTAVVPAIVNANPGAAASWAGFLYDYGAWQAGRPAGEVAEPLVYNAAYRRDALLAVPELARALSAIDHDLWRALAAVGHRAAFEPEARLRHLNVARRGPYLRERFLCGARLGLHRGQRWGWPRRLAYAAAAPLVPFVLAARARGAASLADGARPLPRGVAATAALGLVARATGEAIGYLGLAPASVERHETELELHKVRYAGAGR